MLEDFAHTMAGSVYHAPHRRFAVPFQTCSIVRIVPVRTQNGDARVEIVDRIYEGDVLGNGVQAVEEVQ